jgi:hypothetical protein
MQQAEESHNRMRVSCYLGRIVPTVFMERQGGHYSEDPSEIS